MKLSIRTPLARALAVSTAAAGLVVPVVQAAELHPADRALLNGQRGAVTLDDGADRALFNATGIRTTHRVAAMPLDPADRAMFRSGRLRATVHAAATPSRPTGSGGLAVPSVGETRGSAVAWSSVALGVAMGMGAVLLAGAALFAFTRGRVAGDHSL